MEGEGSSAWVVSEHSVDLREYGVNMEESAGASGRASLAYSEGGFSQIHGDAEERRHQFEMRKFEMEMAAAERRERRESERADREMRLEEKRLEFERKKLRVEAEDKNKNRKFELERIRVEAASRNSARDEKPKKESSVENRIVRSLKLIPEFDETKVMEWFR